MRQYFPFAIHIIGSKCRIASPVMKIHFLLNASCIADCEIGEIEIKIINSIRSWRFTGSEAICPAWAVVGGSTRCA
jgi:hypothetical protein